MANETQLGAWALAHLDKLKLKTERCHWIEELLEGAFDYSISLELEGKEFVGFGAAFSDSLAFNKALTEAIERYVQFEKSIFTSNGLAAHTSAELAIASAALELAERDLFLCHFISKTPFPPMALLALPAEFRKAIGWFTKRNVSLDFFRLGADGVVCVARGFKFESPFGCVIGLGVKNTFEHSVFSAFVECSRRAYKLISVPGDPSNRALSIEQFREISAPTFIDHSRLALDLDYAHQINFLFEGGASKYNVETWSNENPSVELLVPTNKIVSTAPLIFAYASADKVQNLYVGCPNEKLINFDRISEFQGTKSKSEDLTFLPHPLA